MAEHRLPVEDQYPNNSDTARQRNEERRKQEVLRNQRPRGSEGSQSSQSSQSAKDVQKVTKGKVRQRKKPFGRKFAEAFGAQEGQGVIEYILYDIIIPATKNMIVDSIIDGAEMAILGEVRGRRRRPGTGSQARYSYDRVSYRQEDRYRNQRDSRYDDRDRDRRANMRDYEDIMFDYKEDAERVLEQLIEMIDVYGQATIADMYDSAGLTPDSPHLGNYGWTNLSSARSKRVRDGYILDMPRAILL